MNVQNHEKKAFKDMPPEERSAIVEAWLDGEADFFHEGAEEWSEKATYSTLASVSIYRTCPRKLVLPWDLINKEYKWAAMDENGCVCFYKNKPEIDDTTWDGDNYYVVSTVLNIDTTDIHWRESLTQRPE